MYQKVLYFENSDGGRHCKKNAKTEEKITFVPTEKKDLLWKEIAT